MTQEEYDLIKNNYEQIIINIDNGHSLCDHIIVTCNGCLFDPSINNLSCERKFLRVLEEFENHYPELTL